MMITIGQYLQPTKANREVQKYYRPEEFEELKKKAEGMGFSQVAAGPFVRSSYMAEKDFTRGK
jgi:lipoic acid synthetase